MKRIACMLLVIVLLGALGGCGGEIDPNAPEKEYPKCEMVPGTLTAAPLAAEPGNYARSNRTGMGSFMESENGYYFVKGNEVLYYADKTNLEKWVRVCADPKCRHGEMDWNCSARIYNNAYWKDGRIYFAARADEHPLLYPLEEDRHLMFLCSMGPDGQDVRLEHTFEEGIVPGGSSVGMSLLQDGYLYYFVRFEADGTYTSQIWLVRGEEKTLLMEKKLDELMSHLVMSGTDWSYLLGDDSMVTSFEGMDYNQSFYWFHNGKALGVEAKDFNIRGAYLSGQTLRFFRPNDGYYDMDLLTMEQTRLDDAQLSNSFAWIMQPNCILESTLFFNNNQENPQPREEAVMRLFDGQQWHVVELPEELLTLRDNKYAGIVGIASDGVLLSADGMLYRIILGGKTYKAELCGTLP